MTKEIDSVVITLTKNNSIFIGPIVLKTKKQKKTPKNASCFKPIYSEITKEYITIFFNL